MFAATPEAYQLLHEGTKALARIEANGIRIDMEYLNSATKFAGERVQTLKEELRNDDIFPTWRKKYGDRTEVGSHDQLATIIFDVLGHPYPVDLDDEEQEYTEEGHAKKRKADEKILEKVDLPIVGKFLEYIKWRKAKNTYLEGIRREVVDDLLHPSFNLHLVRTYRSSCDTPNFQNIPIREGEMAELIRQCFIAREGHVFVELDYKALEVRIATCYHKDPVMIKYNNDPTTCMHRDAAADCFMLKHKQVSEEARFYAKNQFVFPEFYGSYFKQCAPNLWESIERYDLKTVDGIPLKEHLAKKGIRKLGKCKKRVDPVPGTFEDHIRGVEKALWSRFKVYADWKIRWWKEYQKKGYFVSHTGFCVKGELEKNDCINYPIQGSAFHCNLWSMIQLNKWLIKNKMRSMVVGQIHDSIIGDVHIDELDDFLAKAKQVTTVDLPRHWKWIIVPLSIEASVAPIGSSWFHKEPWNDKQGKWGPGK